MNKKIITPFDPEYVSQIVPFKPVPLSQRVLTQPPVNARSNIAAANDEGKVDRLRRGTSI